MDKAFHRWVISSEGGANQAFNEEMKKAMESGMTHGFLIDVHSEGKLVRIAAMRPEWYGSKASATILRDVLSRVIERMKD